MGGCGTVAVGTLEHETLIHVGGLDRDTRFVLAHLLRGPLECVVHIRPEPPKRKNTVTTISQKMAVAPTTKTGEGDKYRIHMYGDDEKNTKWRYGAPPNYDLVNKLFEQGRTKEWPPGSLEEKVQNLVKTWEMEMFHKTRWDDYKTVDPSKYTFSLNGRKGITIEEKRKLGGGYNALLQTSLPEKYRCYNPAVETADSSHKAFTTAFPRGFAWEVIHVYSGPPVIVYKFRHWGFMEGPFQGHPPTGEMIEFYGMASFEVDDKMEIQKVEFFYDRGELLGALVKDANLGSSGTSSCPFLSNAS